MDLLNFTLKKSFTILDFNMTSNNELWEYYHKGFLGGGGAEGPSSILSKAAAP